MTFMKFPDPALVTEAVVGGKGYKFVNGSWRSKEFAASQGNVILTEVHNTTNTTVVNQTAPYIGPTAPDPELGYHFWENSTTKELSYLSDVEANTWTAIKPKDDFVDTTGALNSALGTTFRLDNTTAGAKTLSFTQTPAAGKDSLLTVLVKGKAGALTYPGNVTWSNAEVPVLTTTITTLIFLWTGTDWVGSVGPQT